MMTAGLEYTHKYISRRVSEITRTISTLQDELNVLLSANEELRKQLEETGGGYTDE